MARVVMPGFWHHATQRGNHQQPVFFHDDDRRLYLELLRHHCTRFSVRITGYCLMNNHVHVLAIPARQDGLAWALGRTHNDYARWLNVRRRQTGHLWQNRFYSCPLDESHRWEALRYVELNPVRAGLVNHAADWHWSSAEAHLSGADPARLLDWTDWRADWSPQSWHGALSHSIHDAMLLERIRHATRTGRPAGNADFLDQAEAGFGRRLRLLKRGPKPRMVGPAAPVDLGVS